MLLTPLRGILILLFQQIIQLRSFPNRIADTPWCVKSEKYCTTEEFVWGLLFRNVIFSVTQVSMVDVHGIKL